MVLIESSCPTCGATCILAAGACTACGASLKVTRPLNNKTVDLLPALNLTSHLQEQQLFKERYRIVRQVGMGGFGAVYEAEDTLEQRQVAIKEIGLAGLTPQQMIEATGSFHREAELLTNLKHPSIPHIYEQLRDSEHWYVVMDFIAGETLEQHLAQMPGGRLPLEQALHVTIQLCDVLEYLHNRQPAVIFRDLKPANIILRPNQQLTIIDFGVARRYAKGKPKDTIAFGSPGYAAPEQYGRAQTTPRSDIYSLGALLHQMLTGQDPSLNPFRFQPLSSLPIELEKLIAQMLETDMMQRPKSMEEVKHKLQAIAASRRLARQHKADPAKSPPLSSAAVLARSFSTVGVTVSKHHEYGSMVTALAWSPDGSMIASCDDRHIVSIWNAFQPSVRHALSLGLGSMLINDIAWSPDGQALAVASENHTIRIWKVRAHPRWWQMIVIGLGFRSFSYEGHASSVKALSWSPDGHMIVSAEAKSAIHVWDTRLNKRLLRYQGHSDEVQDVTWAPDGLRIASCGLDHAVHIWDADYGKDIWVERTKKGGLVRTLAWSPDARYLAGGTGKGSVRVWDTLQKCLVYVCQGHKGAVNSVAWSPDGQRIASAGFDGTVRLWNALDGQELFVYHSHESEGSVFTVAWSPDGQHLASAGQDDQVHVWKAV